MRQRWVCLPIDAITAIFADYAGQVGFPEDGRPIQWFMNRDTRKLKLVVEADSLPEGDNGVEEVKFNIKRVWSA